MISITILKKSKKKMQFENEWNWTKASNLLMWVTFWCGAIFQSNLTFIQSILHDLGQFGAVAQAHRWYDGAEKRGRWLQLIQTAHWVRALGNDARDLGFLWGFDLGVVGISCRQNSFAMLIFRCVFCWF